MKKDRYTFLSPLFSCPLPIQTSPGQLATAQAVKSNAQISSWDTRGHLGLDGPLTFGKNNDEELKAWKHTPQEFVYHT